MATSTIKKRLDIITRELIGALTFSGPESTYMDILAPSIPGYSPIFAIVSDTSEAGVFARSANMFTDSAGITVRSYFDNTNSSARTIRPRITVIYKSD